jgi:hypothetical protein
MDRASALKSHITKQPPQGARDLGLRRLSVVLVRFAVFARKYSQSARRGGFSLGDTSILGGRPPRLCHSPGPRSYSRGARLNTTPSRIRQEFISRTSGEGVSRHP